MDRAAARPSRGGARRLTAAAEATEAAGAPAAASLELTAGGDRPRAGASDRRPCSAPRRERDRRPRHRPPPRLPPAGPDLHGRPAAAPRPVQPTWARVRPRRARAPALGGAQAVRMERVRLAARGAAARASSDAAPVEGHVLVGAPGHGAVADERELPALRPARARAERPDALAR